MAEASSQTGDDLAGVRWDPVKDDYVIDDQLPPEVAEVVEQFGLPDALDRDQFDRLVGAENFAKGLAKLTRYFARVKGVQSIALDESDPAYLEASEVVYRRVMDGPGRHLLPYMSNRDLVDLWIVAAFGVPYFQRVAAEVAEKKKAGRAARGSETERSEGDPENVN